LVSFQHEPQLGEFHTTSNAPPIKGKDGTSPNLGNHAARHLHCLSMPRCSSSRFCCRRCCRMWCARLKMVPWAPYCFPCRASAMARRIYMLWMDTSVWAASMKTTKCRMVETSRLDLLPVGGCGWARSLASIPVQDDAHITFR
jgi:hypothetical protein